MKKLFLLAMGVAAMSALTAQKIDLDRVYVAHQYRDLPSTPLDSTWRTYNVRVEVPSTISGAMSASSIEDRINLQGWKKVYGGGHAQITINFDDLMFDGQKIENRKEEIKNKEGVVTATNYY
jgi:opacity protein-like surface antigen